MKLFWQDARDYDKNVITTALESGADAIFIKQENEKKIKELGLIKTICQNGDLKIGKDVVEIDIKTKQDEINAANLGKSKYVIVRAKNWTIIPYENLIASGAKIIAFVSNSQEAKTAIQTLEKGVSGVLLQTKNLDEIKKTGVILKQQTEKMNLAIAKITKIKLLGIGDRVCVDTCTNMKQGQGMLVGNSSSGMFLVHSECVENPYVDARPFRINAGAIHAYTRIPENKTKYLCELKSGDNCLIVDFCGNIQIAVVGRVKIEKRPLILVEAKTKKNKKISLILQNAETIRLTKQDGKPVSIINLKTGDEVIGFVENAGRHFGMKITETINEK